MRFGMYVPMYHAGIVLIRTMIDLDITSNCAYVYVHVHVYVHVCVCVYRSVYMNDSLLELIYIASAIATALHVLRWRRSRDWRSHCHSCNVLNGLQAINHLHDGCSFIT